MILVDTHAHLDQSEFDLDRPQVIDRATAAGVQAIVSIGVSLSSSRATVAISRQFPEIFAAVGIHPNYTHEAEPDDWEQICSLVASRTADDKIVALGETGLDRFRDHAPFELQQEYFDRHIRLSQQTGLPFLVHARDSLDDVVAMLTDARSRGPLSGVMHSFTGDTAIALQCVALGLHISFAGMVTFKKADALREVAAAVPLERILVETDSPYLSPEPFRGKRNEPAHVLRTAQRIAEMRGLPLAEFAQQTTDNARRLFRLP